MRCNCAQATRQALLGAIAAIEACRPDGGDALDCAIAKIRAMMEQNAMPEQTDEELIRSNKAWDQWRSHRASAASSGLISGGGHEPEEPGRFTFTPVSESLKAYANRIIPDNIGYVGLGATNGSAETTAMTSEEYQRLTAVKEPSGYETIGERVTAMRNDETLTQYLERIHPLAADDSDLPATRGWVRDLLGEENLRIMLSNYAKAELLK
jgi:hypothetical protein